MSEKTYYMSKRWSGLVLFWFWSVGAIVIFIIAQVDIITLLHEHFNKNIAWWLILIFCIIFLLYILVFVPLYTFSISHRIPIVRIYRDSVRVRTETWRKSFPLTWWDMKKDPNGITIPYNVVHSLQQKWRTIILRLKSINHLPPKILSASWRMLSNNDRKEVYTIINSNIQQEK